MDPAAWPGRPCLVGGRIKKAWGLECKKIEPAGVFFEIFPALADSPPLFRGDLPQIPLAHLRVERAEIVEPADAEEAKSQQPQDAGADFTEVKPVQTEKAEKGQQDPRD